MGRSPSTITVTVTSQLLRTRGVALYLLMLVTTPIWIGAAVLGAYRSAASVELGFGADSALVESVDAARWPELRPGDRLLEVDGQEATPAVLAAMRARAPGPIRVVVQRGVQELAFVGEATPRPLLYRLALAVRVGSGATSMLIGLVAFLIRPGTLVSWLFVLFCYDFGASLLALVGFADPTIAMKVVLSGFALGAGLGLHLFSTFPTTVPGLRRRPALGALFHLPALVLVPLVIATPYDTRRFAQLAMIIYVLVGVSALLVTAVMTWLYRRERQRGAADTVAQYRLVLFAVTLGLVVPAVWNLARQVFGLGAAQYVVHWNTLPILWFVAVTAFALVRHNVLLGDRFATAVVGYSLTLGVMGLLLLALGLGASLLLGGRLSGLSSEAQVGATAAAVLLGQPLFRRLKRRIDRWFSRQALDPQQAAEAMAHLARGTQGASRESALQLAVDTLSLLGGDLIELWAVDEEGSFVRRNVRGVPPEGASRTISRQGELGAAISARLSGGVSGLAATLLPAAAATELWAHGLALCAPVIGHGVIAGLLGVGRKRSGASFDAAELAFLTAVAGQIGVVLERATDDGSSFGRYRIERRLGVGGMAEVFLAWQLGPGGFERRVALKRPLPALAEDPVAVAMFLDEARIAAELHHPNIAHVYEVDRHAGTYFIAMEYVDGPPLRTLLRTGGGAVQPAIAAGIVHQILAGLACAHGHSRDGVSLAVVHRDVTPANVLVTRKGEVKLLDFGIARSAARLQVTRTGTVRGTVTYMAPEQAAGRAVDARADLFMAGEIFYELLTGTAPFPDGAKDQAAVPPSVRSPQVTPAIDAFVERALRLEPEERFASAEAMRDALLAAIAPAGPSAIAAWVEARSGGTPLPTTNDGAPDVTRPTRPRAGV